MSALGRWQGVAYVLLAGVLVSVMALLVKLYAGALGSFQLAWFRSTFGLLALLLFVPRMPKGTLRVTQPRRMLGRACLGIPALLCWVYSYSHLPIDTATAITFTRPLFVVPLAFFWLREKTGKGRLLAMLLGFAGVAVAVQPTSGNWFPVVVGLTGALVVAIVCVQVKKLATTESIFAITLYNELFCALIFAPMAWATWQPVPADAVVALVAIGVLGALGQMAMAKGLQLCEATTAASLDYFRFVMAALLSVVFLGTHLSPVLLIGAAMIAISGFYIQFESRVRPWAARLLGRGRVQPARA
jgi:drug/metabolite transporter (DMT)-like permease